MPDALAALPEARPEPVTFQAFGSFDHTPIEVEADRCLVQIRSEDLGRLVMTVARIALTAPVVAIEPAELADTVRQLAIHLGVAPS